ncbi:hypothetical protein [Dyella sp. A6]|nr:hypothetical protein [Dyella sp. A6]
MEFKLAMVDGMLWHADDEVSVAEVKDAGSEAVPGTGARAGERH